MLGNIHSIFAYDVPRPEDVGLPTKCRFNVQPLRCPLLVQCRSIVYDAGLTIIHHWVCCILHGKHVAFSQCCFNVDPPSSTLVKQHWVIVPYFLTAALGVTVPVTFSIPAPETPDNTIYWPNADVMLGHCLRRRAKTKTIQALITIFNREGIFFLNTFYRRKYLTYRDFKRYVAHGHKDWCTEMSTVSHTQHPSFP